MENRYGLLVDFHLSQATGTAERDAVPELIEQARERGFHPCTLGADKGYDTRADCQAVIQAIKAEAAKAPVKELPKEGKEK